MKSKVIELLKKDGVKFSKKEWPKISVKRLRKLGIVPELFNLEFGKACLNSTPAGCNPDYARIGLYLETSGGGSVNAKSLRNAHEKREYLIIKKGENNG